jgi:hypothetical protein
VRRLKEGRHGDVDNREGRTQEGEQEASGCDSGTGEDSQLDHRLARPEFDPDPCREQQHAAEQERNDAPGGPSPLPAVSDRQQEDNEGASEEEPTEKIDASGGALADAGNDRGGRGRHGRRDRGDHPEDCAPIDVQDFLDDPAQGEARRVGRAVNGGEGAKGAQERRSGVNLADDRDGHDDRRDPEGTENAAAQQHGGVRSKRANRRTHREKDH